LEDQADQSDAVAIAGDLLNLFGTAAWSTLSSWVRIGIGAGDNDDISVDILRQGTLRLLCVVSDSLHRTAFHCLAAKSFLLGILWLFIDERMVPVGVAGEIEGRCFPAQIAVDALIIYVEPPGNVLRELVGNVCHNCSAPWGHKRR
jgi:hypothetical protein